MQSTLAGMRNGRARLKEGTACQPQSWTSSHAPNRGFRQVQYRISTKYCTTQVFSWAVQYCFFWQKTKCALRGTMSVLRENSRNPLDCEKILDTCVFCQVLNIVPEPRYNVQHCG